MLGAFTVLALFSFIVATQVSELAQNIPLYQSNILTKVRSLKETGVGGGVIARLSEAIERVGQELDRQETSPPAADQPRREPVPVEIIARERPLQVLQNLIGPLISPLASAGLIIVVVIFMLLEREDLRDRFIRLVGYGDLHRTTEALQDAGKRVGRYLLMQLVVNIVYAIPVTAGLWILGIPNALLWGLLALALRFVPYIGPIIGALLPLFLALAVAPGWSLVLWTAGLFVVMEMITGNVVEPWLYGSRTGLSPLAIIVAAIFWTWLWGPLGLVLSTPLTVCLVVLGRHVPQFEFLDVLFGNEPVLEPHARLYQRLLAGDPEEATDHAEEMLEEKYLFEFYDKVAIPALLLGEQDRVRGVMGDEQRRRVAASAQMLVANLDDSAREEAEEDDDPATVEPATADGDKTAPSGGRGRHRAAGWHGHVGAVCRRPRRTRRCRRRHAGAGARSPRGDRFEGELCRYGSGRGIRRLELDAVDTVVVGFLNRDSVKHARFLVRRLKRARPALRVGIVFWSKDGDDKKTGTAEIGQ